MQRLVLWGIFGYAAYWLLIKGKTTLPKLVATPAQTTGAPQPQPVQGDVEPMANAFNLDAYPMGTFITRR